MQKIRRFQNLCHFPKRNIYIFISFGKAMFAEKKMLSTESIGLSEKAKRREKIMKNNNQINVPQAREAMDKFKMQAAQDVAVSLSNNLTLSST